MYTACSHHVLPMFWAWNFHVLNWSFNQQSFFIVLWVSCGKNKCFWKRFTCNPNEVEFCLRYRKFFQESYCLHFKLNNLGWEVRVNFIIYPDWHFLDILVLFKVKVVNNLSISVQLKRNITKKIRLQVTDKFDKKRKKGENEQFLYGKYDNSFYQLKILHQNRIMKFKICRNDF